MTGKAAFGRAREIVRWEGALGLLRRAVRRALHPIFRVQRLLFFELDLTQPLPKLNARVPLEMRMASNEDLDTFVAALAELGVDAAGARRRLARGDLLTLAISEGTLVNVGWITFSSPYIDEIAAVLELQPGESCGYQAMTHPSWRGLGIQPAAALFRNECQRARMHAAHLVGRRRQCRERAPTERARAAAHQDGVGVLDARHATPLPRGRDAGGIAVADQAEAAGALGAAVGLTRFGVSSIVGVASDRPIPSTGVISMTGGRQ